LHQNTPVTGYTLHVASARAFDQSETCNLKLFIKHASVNGNNVFLERESRPYSTIWSTRDVEIAIFYQILEGKEAEHQKNVVIVYTCGQALLASALLPSGYACDESTKGGRKMKKMVAIMLAVVLGTSLVYPAAAQAGHYYVAQNYHGPARHYNSHSYYDGWTVAGAAVGGALLGVVIGSAVSSPRYVAAPAPVYAYPQPVYAYPSAGYASPGPVNGYEAPPGEWVTVPGKWINGKWVPSHRVWVPVNP
jgi:hypothetical protein